MKQQEAKAPLSDDRIVELYFLRDERAISETDFKFKNYLFSVAYNIVHDRPDCEECLNDTYLGAWNTMPPTRPHSLKALLTVIMRRVAVNRYHSNARKGRVPSEMTVSLSELEDFLSEDDGAACDSDAVRLGHVISDFVQGLSARRQFIFMSRYYVSEPIDAIAGELSVSRSTVNKELAAIRTLLKEHLEKEGYKV